MRRIDLILLAGFIIVAIGFGIIMYPTTNKNTTNSNRQRQVDSLEIHIRNLMISDSMQDAEYVRFADSIQWKLADYQLKYNSLRKELVKRKIYVKDPEISISDSGIYLPKL